MLRTVQRIAGAGFLALLVGCSGALSDSPKSDPEASGPTGDSEAKNGAPEIPEQPSKPNPVPIAGCVGENGLLQPKLRRLSELQIRNSLVDIFGDLFDPQGWPTLEDGAKLIGMNTMADKLQINSLNFSRVYDASRSVVRTLLQDHPEFSVCAKSTESSDCVGSLVEEYGLKLWRRPLTTEERTQLDAALGEFNDNETKLEFVLNALLLSSEFLFRSEIGSANGTVRALNNYELVSFLAYTVWNSTPDDTLLMLAAQPEPLSEVELRSQLERMLEDPRVNAALVEIYKDYLKLDLVLEREKESSFDFNPGVRRSLLSSAEMTLSSVAAPEAETMTVFGSGDFYVNREIAPFFGVESSSESLRPAPIDAAERHGVLNHPAFLAVHSTLNASGIVKRGVFTLEQLLCRSLPPPPADVSSLETPAELNPETTSERNLLIATHSSQPTCNGCHQFIDPAGFGFENFDAVGRFRTTEKGGVPIDASGELEEVGSYGSSAEFSRALVASGAMKDCVTRRFLEHFVGQDLDPQSCELQTYTTLVNQGSGDIRGLFTALTQLRSVSARQNSEETL